MKIITTKSQTILHSLPCTDYVDRVKNISCKNKKMLNEYENEEKAIKDVSSRLSSLIELNEKCWQMLENWENLEKKNNRWMFWRTEFNGANSKHNLWDLMAESTRHIMYLNRFH